MSAFRDIALGEAIPNRLHAVSCSLPTMRSVRGYEEKDPEVVAQLVTGYPRFVVHPLVRRLADHLGADPAFAGRTLWLTSSLSMAGALRNRLGAASGAQVFSRGTVHGVCHPHDKDLAGQAKVFLQNIGGFLSSREAEDCLVSLGALSSVEPEATFKGEPAAEIRRHLKSVMSGVADEDILLAPSGMNAVYSAFKAIDDLQAARGRTLWIQLGWLYLDSIAILKKFTKSPGDYLYVSDCLDLSALKALFATHGHRIAGVITEVPSNPLVQTADLDALSSLCREHGARLVLDPSVGSVYSVDVLRYSDLLCCSLTKYTGSDGDIVAGALFVNPKGPDAVALRRNAASTVEPVYWRDLARLAEQIQRTREVLAAIEASTPRVAAFLESHPKVKEVFWALHPRSAASYLRYARSPTSVGGMISFTLRSPMEPFYDALRLPKGPSFGMSTTLICPFMYLAHYDLVTSPEGRRELAASGLDPDLLRLCVGTEPAEDIIASLSEALG